MSHAGTSYVEPVRDAGRGGKGFKHNVGRLIQGHHLSDLVAFQQKLIWQPTVVVNDRILGTYERLNFEYRGVNTGTVEC